MSHSAAARRYLIYSLFFISGACGLIYQTAWVRQMSLVFGVTTYAISSVLLSFMGGLALGSLYFGYKADHLRNPLRVYGLLEIGIAISAICFAPTLALAENIFAWMHHLTSGNHYLFSLCRLLIILPVLLVPTFMMGATLPLIVRHFVRRRDQVGMAIGGLYALNTLGAVAGTFLVGFVMLAKIGTTHSIWVAAALNTVVGVIALVIARHESIGEPLAAETLEESLKNKPEVESPDLTAGDPRAVKRQALLVLWVIALSGFSSLGLQVLWNRVLVYYTHNSTYAFSSILMVNLVGLALGSAFYGVISSRIRSKVMLLAVVELGIMAWTIAGFGVLAHLAGFNSWLSGLLTWNNWYEVLALIFTQVGLLLLVPTFLMGMTLPVAIHILTERAGAVGRRVGVVYGFNTLGTVVGIFLVGFVFLPWAGVRSSFLILAGLNGLIVLLLAFGGKQGGMGSRVALAVATIAIMVVGVAAVPADAIRRTFERNLGRVVYYHEDVTDTVMAVDLLDYSKQPPEPSAAKRFLVYSDGRGTAGHETVANNRFTAHLSLLMHPDPQDVLAICIGAGNSIGAMATHSRIKHLDCVDLSKGVIKATEYFETNEGIFKEPRDPRLNVYVEDGRNFLKYSRKKYDVIHLDPPEPHTAGVVFLFTKEFYELCRAHLKPGGVVVNWVAMFELSEDDFKRMAAAFLAVFPEGQVWHDPVMNAVHFVGSDRPFRIPLRKVQELIAKEPRVLKNLTQVHQQNPLRFYSTLVFNEQGLRRWVGDAPPITDDRTHVDFSSPRSLLSAFGFHHMLSPNTWSSFVAAGSVDMSQMQMGGWTMMRKMMEVADEPASVIDFSGFSADEETSARQKLAFYDQQRRQITAEHERLPVIDVMKLPEPQ